MKELTTKRVQLYPVLSTLFSLEEMLIESGGELTEEIEALLEFSDDQVQGAIGDAVKAYRQFTVSAAAVKAEEQRLRELRQTWEKAAESMKRVMDKIMQAKGLTKVEAENGLGIVTRVRNSRPSVTIDAEADVPLSYRRGVPPLKPPKGVTKAKYMEQLLLEVLKNTCPPDSEAFLNLWKEFRPTELTDAVYRAALVRAGHAMTREEAMDWIASEALLKVMPHVHVTQGTHVRIR